MAEAHVESVCTRSDLRGDPENRVDKLALRHGIAFDDPADLTFAKCAHCL